MPDAPAPTELKVTGPLAGLVNGVLASQGLTVAALSTTSTPAPSPNGTTSPASPPPAAPSNPPSTPGVSNVPAPAPMGPPLPGGVLPGSGGEQQPAPPAPVVNVVSLGTPAQESATQPLTEASLESMSVEQISAQWDSLKPLMEA